MVCWALWSHRNNIVWRNQRWTTYQLLSFAGKTLTEWRQAQQCKVMTQKSLEMPDSMPIHWNKLPYNWTKLDVDAAIFNNGSSTGLGCFLHDHEGTFLAARSVNKQIHLEPREAEALSVREALHWIRIQYLSNVIVEMDSLLVFQAITSSGRANSPFDLLVQDCIELAQQVANLKFNFVKRTSNSAAHYVAKAANSFSVLHVWEFRIPDFLLSCLQSDLHQLNISTFLKKIIIIITNNFDFMFK